MQEKFVIIENTLIRNLYARLYTANLSWPGICVVLRIRSVYMDYREREYTVLVFHLSKYNFVKQSSLGAAKLDN